MASKFVFDLNEPPPNSPVADYEHPNEADHELGYDAIELDVHEIMNIDDRSSSDSSEEEDITTEQRLEGK